MFDLKFDNRFVAELPGDPQTGRETRQVEHACFSRVLPTPVTAPRLVAVEEELARRIGFTEADWKSPEFAQIFGGNTTLPGMDPFAACYGGHQFGNWAGQLGDGRAISLGEVLGAQGERFELQLKGAGPTPYSRRADGRAVLRSSIREFLCSEAMHHLGVPTTRALSLVATGDLVERDMFYDGNAKLEAGAIVCRVAPSFIRFGNFELPSVRGDIELLTKLVDFTIDRDYRLEGSVEERRERWFDEICTRTAKMIVHWMRVGFVHGVMNTDNMSILGLTIDYGPYGWLDDFDPSFTPNTTDSRNRRYRFGAQPTIAQWNLVRLAEALIPVFPSIEPLERGIARYAEVFDREFRAMMANKFGLLRYPDEADDVATDGMRLLQKAEVDMTLFFRGLADLDANAPTLAPIEHAFYSETLRAKHEPELLAWLERYAARLRTQTEETASDRRARMNAVNPHFILRNYLAQRAIELAESGDESMVLRLFAALRDPYSERPERADLVAKRPEWAKRKAGSSMLSCSS